VRRVLQLNNKKDQVDELLRCESAGILCLVTAAFPDLYLDTACPKIPPDELENDCRGRLDIPQIEEIAYVDIGEVKMALDYAKAIEQLGLRLGAIK